ncbi:MAG: helix-turn-helix domain-containing protein [Betaproteobacteria bacterium]
MTDMADDPELRMRDRGPGAVLAAARTAQNLSVADVARQLKLSASQVNALEAGEFERLPGPVFVRGFVRNYARLLRLDPDRLLDMMSDAPGTELRNEMPTARGVPFSTGSARRWPRYVMLVALLAIGALAAYEFHWSERAASSPAPASTAAVPPKLTLPASAVPAPAASAVRSQADQRVREPASEPVTTAPAATTAPPEQALLRFVFKRDSWVQVREADGRTIFTRLNPAGTEQQVTGRPPFSLVIGNADGVLLSYDDQAIDLVPHIAGGGVARLTLK